MWGQPIYENSFHENRVTFLGSEIVMIRIVITRPRISFEAGLHGLTPRGIGVSLGASGLFEREVHGQFADSVKRILLSGGHYSRDGGIWHSESFWGESARGGRLATWRFRVGFGWIPSSDSGIQPYKRPVARASSTNDQRKTRNDRQPGL